MGTLSYTPTLNSHNAIAASIAFHAELSSATKPSTASQEEMILLHLPTVRYIAKKLQRTLPAHVELEELIAAGTLGLVDAAARFQPESGVLFATFAQFRVRGAILDSLRELDWAPRELRRKARSVEEAMIQVTRRTGTTPEEAEVAKEMGLALSDYQVLLGELDGLEIESLHVERSEGSGEEEIAYVASSGEESPLSQCLQSEAKQRLVDAIDGLPKRERLVMSLYYYEELTMKEIGGILEVAESRVSQIRASAVLKLRVALGASGTARKSRALTSAA